jgi:hypothetical protein
LVGNTSGEPEADRARLFVNVEAGVGVLAHSKPEQQLPPVLVLIAASALCDFAAVSLEDALLGHAEKEAIEPATQDLVPG